MSFSISKLQFSPSTEFFWLGLLALVAIGVLSITAWRRSARRGRTGMLEALRFFIALVIVLMLWKPEWRDVTYPEDRPEIAILWDGSPSMTTDDMVLPTWLDEKGEASTRADYIEKVLASPFWKDLEKDGTIKLIFQDFSKSPEGAKPEELAKLGSDLNTPLTQLIKEHDNLRAVILLSDGSHNIDRIDDKQNQPTQAAQKMSIAKTPLFTVPIGSETSLPDLDLISINAPDFGISGEFVQVNFSIKSTLEKDVRTTVRLRDNQGKEKTKNITIPANKTLHDSIIWKLEKEGTTKLNLSIPFVNGERIRKNNSEEFVIGVKKESIKALVIESRPRWEYRFIRNALSRDPGVDVDCLLLHPSLGKGDGPDYIQDFPEKLEDLQKYDVVFLGDVGVGEDQLTEEQANLLAGLVKEQASGIVFIPGPMGNQATLKGTDLEDLIPVIVDEKNPKGFHNSSPSPLNLTPKGQSSLLTLLGQNESENKGIWRKLPGFYWHAAVEKKKSGATVLATHANSRNAYGAIPMLTTMQAGSGKTLYLAHDSAWRWRRGVEDLYHFRFWKNVARWMSYQRNMAAGERIRIYRTPDRPKLGKVVSLSANAFDANGVPLKEGNVYVDVTDPNGKYKRYIMERSEGNWGAFSSRFTVDTPGEWKLVAGILDDESAKPVSTSVIALGDSIEKVGKPINMDLLKELARITKGEMIAPEALNSIADKINALPEKQPLENITPIWSDRWLLYAMIALMGIFWLGRKLNGTF